MNRTILLNPGPVTLSERVRRSLLQPDLCHREPEFAELTLDIKARLAAVYPAAARDYTAVLLTGSGTCAVEAMLSTLVPPEGKVLVVSNGVYGERMAAMIRAHGKPLQVIASPWLEPMDLEEVAACLNRDPAITHVLAVHHETTTGRLNDIAQLGRLCRRHQVALLLDSVSSFGAEAIEFGDWNLEACAATGNKCLHGVPGMSFVLVKQAVFETRPSAANTVYLDLHRYHREQANGYSPFTQAVQVAYALQEALREMEDAGGWMARHGRYRQISQRILRSLQALGVKPLLNPPDVSCVLSAFQLPPGSAYHAVHEQLKASGFIIYAGQGKFNNEIFRIANMGDIQDSDLDRLLACCHDLFNN